MIDAGLALLPARMDTPAARVMLVAIALQESRMKHRRQLVGNPPKPLGPAAGLWQFEKGGGIKGVLTHPASAAQAREVCKARGVEPTVDAVWSALQYDDVLACALARLLLWTDPHRLPEVGDADGAWALYLRVWRPGKPHPETWGNLYAQAVREVTS